MFKAGGTTMTLLWIDVLKIIGGYVGGSVIIIPIFKYLLDKYFERISKKHELKLNKELEQFKEILGNKSHVSRARFDLEFRIYGEISYKFLVLLDEMRKSALTENGIKTTNENLANITKKLHKLKKLLYCKLPILPKDMYDFLNSKLSELFGHIENCQAIQNETTNNNSALKTAEDIDLMKKDIVKQLKEHFNLLDIAN